MAHIRSLPKKQDGSRRYQVRYLAPDGRETAKTFSRKVDADRFAATVETDKARGDWTDPRLGRVTVNEWARRYMDSTVHLKPKTRNDYESLLRSQILPVFGKRSLAAVEQVAVRQWVADLQAQGLSASRIRNAYNLLGATMKAAVAAGYLARTPCVGIKLPRLPKHEMLFLDSAQVGRLADAIRPPYGALVYLLAYGGLRFGEAAALRRSRCDLLRGRIEVTESLADVNGHLYFGTTKTHENRRVVVPVFLRDLLARHLAEVPGGPDSLVFTAPGGGPLRYGNFYRRIWKQALAAAELDSGLGIHALRHTCTALLIAQGAQAKEIQDHLGHSSIQVTMDRYGHLFPDVKDRLAASLEAVFQDSGRTLDGLRVVRLPGTQNRNTA